MGRAPCCDKVGLKKGPWTPEEDQMLLAYIEQHGNGSWRSLPGKAGLQRCGKSCRLRWANYLRPDIKRGKFSLQEEQIIIQLHALLGNRWSAIATHLPKRTDNEIKNYWNTHLKKRLNKMGIDPITHKPKNEALSSTTGPSKSSTNLSHIAQWESARLEAEVRLARQSKLRTKPDLPLGQAKPPESVPPCLSILKAWNVEWWTPPESGIGGDDLESPTSTLTFSNNVNNLSGFMDNENSIDLALSSSCFKESAWVPESPNENENGNSENFMMGFTELLLKNSNVTSLNVSGSGDGNDVFEDNKNYWNSVLDFFDSSPSDSPVF